jgi:hypothetical protein
MRVLPLALVLAACHHSAPQATLPPPPAGLACAKVAEHLVAAMHQDPPPPQDVADKVTGIMTQRCEGDTWTEDAKQCLNTTTSIADAKTRCGGKLTAAQQDNVNQQMMEAFDRGAPPARDEDAAAPPPPALAQPGGAAPAANRPAKAATKAAAPRSPSKPGKAGGDPCDGSE